jgi:hypothetical protein
MSAVVANPEPRAQKQEPLTNISFVLENSNDREAGVPLSDSETVHSSPRSDVPDHPDHGSLQRIPTADHDLTDTVEAQRTATDAGPMYSVFTKNQKIFIVFMASWAGFFSPVSGQIYFPALNALARDLHVSNSLINLTLTSYMVRVTTLRAVTGLTLV